MNILLTEERNRLLSLFTEKFQPRQIPVKPSSACYPPIQGESLSLYSPDDDNNVEDIAIRCSLYFHLIPSLWQVYRSSSQPDSRQTREIHL